MTERSIFGVNVSVLSVESSGLEDFVADATALGCQCFSTLS